MAGEILGFTVNTWDAIGSVGSVIGGLGGLAGFVALWIETRIRRQAKRLPPPELLPLLLSLRSDFNEIVSGGISWSWFIQDEQKKRESELAAWIMMINDDRLRQHVRDASSDMHDAGAWARRDASPTDVQNQSDAAHRGVSSIDKAITRIGELRRKYG